MNEFEIKMTERMTKVETDITNIKEKVDDMSSMKDAVLRLVTLQEGQKERDAKIDSMQEDQIKINTEVHLTLKNINTNLNLLNTEVGELKNQFTTQKIESLKEQIQEQVEDKKENIQIKVSKISSRAIIWGSLIASGLALFGVVLSIFL
jgi:hypothetical protein